jgi:hypothetical protein
MILVLVREANETGARGGIEYEHEYVNVYLYVNELRSTV